MINQIDIELYDRQIRTYGFEATSKIIKSSILIIGLDKGLGTEIGKNLSLCGIKHLFLLDENKINNNDLETGYYYSRNDINNNRASVLLNKLKELNPYVSIIKADSYKNNQNITIMINQNINYVLEVSNYCRQNNSKIIVLYSGGLSGILFIDAGINHMINDITGEIIDSVQIADISNLGIVKCAQNTTHNFQSNDIIKFNNIQGINIQKFYNEWKIEVINNTTFKLIDFSHETDFKFLNGTAIHIKQTIIINHKSFKDQLINHTINSSFDNDYSEKLINTYLQLYNNNLIHQMPFIWADNNDDFMNKNNIILKDQAKTFNYELISVVSIMGSLAASEAIKLITNKYMPINQWFTWTDKTLIPKDKPLNYNLNSSYSILYGTEYENKLINSNILIVGSGAIGCEYLKNFAFMNISNNNFSNSKIIITDHDNIEKSNLNRQFLFRPHDIGKSKSDIAAKSISLLKSNLNIVSLYQKVGNDNINFTDNIFNDYISCTNFCVFNALDNIIARKFMDEQCFKYNIPLFESGTNGTKGNTQPIIPFITETYSASSDQEHEKTFPLCTIKSFPNEIQHVVYWAMDHFELFNRMPTTLNNWINNPTYLSNLSDYEKSVAINDIYKFTIEYKMNSSKLSNEEDNKFLRDYYLDMINIYIKYAIDTFIENYYIIIMKLLDVHKYDNEISHGVLFWSGGRRCPKPIKFDPLNKLHIDYIESTIHILMRIYKLDNNFKIEDFMININNYSSTINYEQIIKSFDVKKEITLNNSSYYESKILSPQIFDKDDITNWHIQWITACSNLRAINYDIMNEDQYTIKGIAGRIIPAIATTTSLVSGLIILEFLKYLLNNNSNIYKSTFINLAEPIIIYSDPIDAPFIDICGVKVNSWQKFEYKINNFLDYTLKKFKNHYEELFKTNITMIVMDTCIIYADFIQDDLDNKLYDILINNSNSDKIILTLLSADSIELPFITILMN